MADYELVVDFSPDHPAGTVLQPYILDPAWYKSAETPVLWQSAQVVENTPSQFRLLWTPAEGDTYWYITERYEVQAAVAGRSPNATDNSRAAVKNMFRTQQLADAGLMVMKAELSGLQRT